MDVQAERSLILISTFILVRFWKAAAFLFLCALASLTLLGIAETAGFLTH